MDAPVMCPSAPAGEGAVILGVVNADGSIAYLGQRLIATRDFMDVVTVGREPEQRFRFASPCRQDGCKQWVEGGCGVPDRVKDVLPATAVDHLPRCSIRPQCRWYRQSAAEACRICPWVITRGPVEDEISSAAR